MQDGFRRNPTRDELLDLIAKSPGDLEGLVESQWLDFKRDPHLKPAGNTQPQHRFELAKDVTAMANAGGGLIVWGVDETKSAESATRLVGKLSPVSEGVVDESQIRKTLREWVFPTVQKLGVLERRIDARGSIWVIDIPPPGANELPFIIVREWPPGKDDKRPSRGHFTMYMRAGTDNFHVPPEELYQWIQAGYHSKGGGLPPNGGALPEGEGGGSTPPDRGPGQSTASQGPDDALEELKDSLGVDPETFHYFIQLVPKQSKRIPGFFSGEADGFMGRMEAFETLRPHGFTPFSRYSQPERTPSNSLYRGFEGKGGALVADQGLATFVCCEEILTWASEKAAPRGSLLVNYIALPEFTLDACRYFISEVLPISSVGPDAEYQWRVGMHGLGGSTPVHLAGGRPDPLSTRATWDFEPPPSVRSFSTPFVSSADADAGSLALAMLVEVFHQCGHDKSAVPFQLEGRIDESEIRNI